MSGPFKGYVEGIHGCLVVGWAFYNSGDAICLVKVKTSSGKEVGRGHASHPREDLRAIGIGRMDFAFEVEIEYPSNNELLYITVDDVPLAGSPQVVGHGIFDGHFSVQSGVINGVVTERALDSPAPHVRFEDQYGRVVAEGLTSVLAEDRSTNPASATVNLPLRSECFGFEELFLRAFANGTKFAHASCPARLIGYLDTISPIQCCGWLLSPDAPDRQFDIDILHEGKRVGGGKCDLPRDDLKDMHPLAWKTAGFDFRLDLPNPGHSKPVTVSIRLANSDTEVLGGPFLLTSRPGLIADAQRVAAHVRADDKLSNAERSVALQALYDFIKARRFGQSIICEPTSASASFKQNPRRFNIIIPIYKGVDTTRNCIRSVVATRDPDRDAIILINDCSPEPGIAEALSEFSNEPDIHLLHNEQNLGFIGSVNRGLAFCRAGHVVLLNSDTVVFPGAWDEMERLLVDGTNIGTITALSNNATIFSYPHVTLVSENPLADISWEELAAVALEANTGLSVDVPTGHGFCMLIRRDVLDGVGPLDIRFGRGYGEENDFCMRAADLGWRNVAACGVFVEHKESISFFDEKYELIRTNIGKLSALYPEYTPSIMAFERTDALRTARWPLDRHRLKRAAAAGTSYVLIVQNWLDGGTKQAIRDIENAYGYGDRERITLTCRADGFRELHADQPLVHSVFAPDEDDALFEVLSDAGVDLVLVHQLLGSTADFIRRISGWGSARQMKFYMHDFYPLCPRVTMINAIGRFCHVADTGTCGRCIEMGGSHTASRLDDVSPELHRMIFRDYLQQCAEVIAPSDDTVHWVGKAFPGIAITSMPHPVFSGGTVGFRQGGDSNQIVLLGAIGPHKGSRRLLELAREARISYPSLRFHVVGYTDIDQELSSVGNVSITGRYKHEDLQRLVGKTGGRVALFLHEWPETFSYTLSEAWALGLWPIVPTLGAPAERVAKSNRGYVADISSAAELLDALDRIDAGWSDNWPKGIIPAKADLDQRSVRLRRSQSRPRGRLSSVIKKK